MLYYVLEQGTLVSAFVICEHLSFVNIGLDVPIRCTDNMIDVVLTCTLQASSTDFNLNQIRLTVYRLLLHAIYL